MTPDLNNLLGTDDELNSAVKQQTLIEEAKTPIELPAKVFGDAAFMSIGRDHPSVFKKHENTGDSFLNPNLDFGKKMSRPNFKFSVPETEPREGGLNQPICLQ